ncbi:MAG: Crp/Fnr family transcriptional regulator [Acidobacteriales bacterium]|nr:Crp/Fnr family transcriptional regulator [Terriglobales bacterium]
MRVRSEPKVQFDAKHFLASIGQGRTRVAVSKKRAVFCQDDPCDAIFYIQQGRVILTVVSSIGKEAILGILNAGEFFGESCLVRQPRRMASARALTNCTLLRIESAAMLQAIHSQHTLSDLFVEYLLAKNIRYQEDLIDHLFNSSEKRLARILLLFAGFGKDGIAGSSPIPKISQETLAEMVGTTRSRVSAFMNRFRRLGFIEYNGKLVVHSALLNVVLHG